MRLGTRWNRDAKAMEWSKESELEDQESGISEDVNTIKQFARMATDTIECLNFTFDSPELGVDNHMPVLDTDARDP